VRGKEARDFFLFPSIEIFKEGRAGIIDHHTGKKEMPFFSTRNRVEMDWKEKKNK
jgi:hypothetical protein